MAVEEIQAGMVLGGYKLITRLGAGAMGEVWRASNVHVETMIRAVKVIQPELAANPDFRARFLREAQLLESLHHRNILEIHDIGEQDGCLFLSMELLDGMALDQVLRQRGPLPFAMVADIGAQTSEGIAFAHAAGVMHRDLKPANLFLQKDGVAKVLDFGIAKAMDSAQLTSTGMMQGSPAYIAPEFAEGGSASAASDIYAMAVSLYQLVAGKLPFVAGEGTPAQVWSSLLVQHATRPLPDLRTIRPGVPDALRLAIEHAAQKRPDARPTAAELAEELHAARQEMPDAGMTAAERSRPAHKAPTAEELAARTHVSDINVPRPPPKRRGGMLVGGLVLGLLVLGGAGYLGRSYRSHSSVTATPTPSAAQQPTSGPVESGGMPPGMVVVAGGVLQEGRPDYGAPEALDAPVHEVPVKRFAISKTEVTIEAYRKFAEERHLPTPWPASLDPLPIVGVSWSDAAAYCAWLPSGHGRGRLPTEAEWEMAARGPDGHLYPWGNEFRTECVNGQGGDRGKVEPPGSHDCGATASGIQDMAGNVWEWTADSPSAYPGSKARVPPASAGFHMIRGGSFYNMDPNDLTATSRAFLSAPNRFTGFRCAADLR